MAGEGTGQGETAVVRNRSTHSWLKIKTKDAQHNTQKSVLGSDSLPFFKFQEKASESTLLRYWRKSTPLYLQTKMLPICSAQTTFLVN